MPNNIFYSWVFRQKTGDSLFHIRGHVLRGAVCYGLFVVGVFYILIAESEVWAQLAFSVAYCFQI